MTRSPLLVSLLALALVGCSADADQATDGASPSSSSPSSSSSSSPEAVRALDELVADVTADMATYDGIVSAISVAISQDGETRTIIQGPAIADADQRFMIASISKPMVAAAVLSLVEAGELALDDAVDDLVPGLLPRAAGVTVEHLLSMSSGLADYQQLDTWRGPNTTSSAGLVKLIAKEPLSFEPGTQGSYNNSNFAVLDVVVQQVTGASLAALLDHAVFGPAHLDHTSLGDDPDVAGTTIDGDPYRPTIEQPSAAAGVVASAEDVALFFEALTAGDLISPDLLADMESEHAATDIGSYGLGLTLEDFCGQVFGHEGNNDGYESVAWTIPDIGRTVVVLVNAGDAGVAGSIAVHALCD